MVQSEKGLLVKKQQSDLLKRVGDNEGAVDQ